MKTSRYVVMGIAALAAILLAFLVRGLIAGKASHEATAQVQAPPPAPTTKVLIATHEIKAGTRIADGDLTWQDWPVASLNPAYIVDGAAQGGTMVTAGSEEAAAKAKGAAPLQKVGNAASSAAAKVLTPGTKEAYIGGVARQDILANEPIIDAKVVRSDEGGFMAVMLEPGMRAMAVQVSVENTAGGFILPGDRVDILATHQVQRSGGSGTADTVQPVLRNIRVLAIDQQVQTDKDKQSVIGATATLEVSPTDGQALALAKASGSLSLMLRSYADASGPAGVVTGGPPGGDQSVRVFRNGQTSEVLVSR